MEEGDLRALETIFAQVEDPRIERTKLHRLRDIIIIAICGVICGADGWVGVEEFGKAKEAWFHYNRTFEKKSKQPGASP
jgi:DDE_Tnp_1-associated